MLKRVVNPCCDRRNLVRAAYYEIAMTSSS
jgi:hypothetical protein